MPHIWSRPSVSRCSSRWEQPISTESEQLRTTFLWFRCVVRGSSLIKTIIYGPINGIVMHTISGQLKHAHKFSPFPFSRIYFIIQIHLFVYAAWLLKMLPSLPTAYRRVDKKTKSKEEKTKTSLFAFRFLVAFVSLLNSHDSAQNVAKREPLTQSRSYILFLSPFAFCSHSKFHRMLPDRM